MKSLQIGLRYFMISLIMLSTLGTSLYGQVRTDTNIQHSDDLTKEQTEDLMGRIKWWQLQRTGQDDSIPIGLRQRAINQKSQMMKVDKPFEEDVIGRDQWWYYQRIFPSDSIPFGARQKALEYKLNMPYDSLLEGEHHSPPVSGICNWISIGPRNINGRIRSMAIHPSNGNIIFAGAAEGGVWRSNDAGQSWYPLMQHEMSLAIGALAIDPTNPNIIYAGTGEPTTWPGYEGVGVLKSTDGGITWSNTGSIGNGHIARLAIDPTNTNIIYCAGFFRGLYRSPNGGTNWSPILSGDVTDFILHPSSTNILYAGIRNDGVYMSLDSGVNWTKLAGGLPAGASNRVMLSICNASPQIIYAKLDETVYKSSDGGTNWSNLGNHGGTTHGYWCTYVMVDPTDPDIVFSAGYGLERSKDGGATWTWVMGGTNSEKDRLHADQHAMVFDPTNNQRAYAGNDGGVYLSEDGANTWKKVSDGLIVTQFYDIGYSKASQSMLGGGTQDQGTNATVGSLTWQYLFNADGGFLIYDPSDPYILYGETQHNNITKSIDGGANWISAITGLIGTGPWIGSIVLDDASPNILFTGRQQVFKTTNGASNWISSSPTVGGLISAIAIAPSNHQIIYAGTSNGEIWKSTDGGSTLTGWSDVTTNALPYRFLTDIAVDRTDPDLVYLTYSGFNSSTRSSPGHVFRSTDGGRTWSDVSGQSGVATSIPDIPVNAIEIDANNANTIYIGTDIGVFRTLNTGGVWTVFEPGLPQVAVVDLELNIDQDILYAASHGRGMWKISVGPTASCSDVDIYMRDDHLDTGEEIPSPSGVVDPYSVIRGGSIGHKVYRWQSPDIKIDAKPFYVEDALFDGVEFDRDLTHDDPLRNFVNKVYIQVHNRGPFNATNVTVKILYADASAGLPALPTDFWTNYPNNASDISVWHPIGTYKTIPVLEPTRPAILSWNWTPPSSAATHSCIIAVIDSPDDPIPVSNKVLNVNWLIGNESHVSLKNLHIIIVPPTPAPSPKPPHTSEIVFNNDTKEEQVYDIIFDREFFPLNVGKLLVDFNKLKTQKPLNSSIEGIEIVKKRGSGCKRFFARIFRRIEVPPPIIEIVSNDIATIKSVVLEPGEAIQAKLEIDIISTELESGSKYRFSIIQHDGKGILGGSTYELRIQEQ